MWCRIYHAGKYAPHGESHRSYGPLGRLDHHEPHSGGPRESPTGRSILYVADSLTTAIGEVFGEPEEARVCPWYRVAILVPPRPITVLDLKGKGTAMRLKALPSIATGPYSRELTQEWARAIHDDQPVDGVHIRGVRYEAAYSGGTALALWGTDGLVATATLDGAAQDFALGSKAMWPRFHTRAWNDLRIPASRISAADCSECAKTS